MSGREKYLSIDGNAGAPSQPTVDRMCWATPQDVVRYTGRHYTTIRRALTTGELHGHQNKSGGRWSIDLDCVDAWVKGEESSATPCDCPEGRRARAAYGIALRRK